MDYKVQISQIIRISKLYNFFEVLFAVSKRSKNNSKFKGVLLIITLSII